MNVQLQSSVLDDAESTRAPRDRFTSGLKDLGAH